MLCVWVYSSNVTVLVLRGHYKLCRIWVYIAAHKNHCYNYYRPLIESDVRPVELYHFRWSWVTFIVKDLLQPYEMQFFVQLCSSRQHFNWHSASRGLSVTAKLFVAYRSAAPLIQKVANFSATSRCFALKFSVIIYHTLICWIFQFSCSIQQHTNKNGIANSSARF